MPEDHEGLAPNELKLKAPVEAAAVEVAAAGEAGGGAPERAGAGKLAPAMRAEVKIAARPPGGGEGKIVTALFIRDPEIGAGAAPFHSMRRESPAPGAGLREEMRQFVAQSAIDLRFAMRAKTAIEQNS